MAQEPGRRNGWEVNVKNFFQAFGMVLIITIVCCAIAWIIFWGSTNAATGGIVIIAVMAHTVGWFWYHFVRWTYRGLRGLPTQFSSEGD